MSAIFSACGTYRHRLEREVQPEGVVFAYFGVNPSKAGAIVEDQTTMKWRGFTLINGGRRYIAGNAFGYRATAVRDLASVADPVGPGNADHINAIIADADILVPCWGSRIKLPKHLRIHLDDLMVRLLGSGKPVKVFGRTSSGDPKHPLMLGYDTPLTEWSHL